MPDDTAALRSRLHDYLAARGIPVQDGSLSCPNPEHADPGAYAEIEGDGLVCSSCATRWDVFDVAGLLDHIACRPNTFPERVKAVRDTLAAHRPRPRPAADLSDAELAAVKAQARASGNGHAPVSSPTDYLDPPFRVLGADGDRGWYIGRGDNVITIDLQSLGKMKLFQLADMGWWVSAFQGAKGRLDQDSATDWLVGATRALQFEQGSLRGRGAWRESDGSLVFHDGETTLGHPDPRRIYQRKAALGVLRGGVRDVPAAAETRAAMLQAAKSLSFETPADCARLLAWSAIAPFCGALPWRPAGFLTGVSQSGKSTILQYIVSRLAMPLSVSGSSTEAYIRQATGNDARPIVIDEAESADDDGRRHVMGILALMRQSTSDDAPLIGKGTTTGKPLSFNTRNMYLFSAISQGAEKQADANRLFMVDLQKPEGDTERWQSLRSGLVAAWTPANCAAVRAHTWRVLPEIIDGAEAMADAVQRANPAIDTRYALLEGVLWSTFWRVWMPGLPAASELADWLALVYQTKVLERAPDDSDVLLRRILQQDVPLHGVASERYTLGALLREKAQADRTGDPGGHDYARYERVRNTLRQYGLWVLERGDREGCVAVPIERVQIAKILGQPQYHKTMRRHPSCVSRTHPVADGSGGQARCMLFSVDVLGGEPEELEP